MEFADFLTLEDRVDLIVSFAISGEVPEDVISLTLLRTPKYEPLLPPEERGVWISRDDRPKIPRDMLAAVNWQGDTVVLVSTSGQRYEVDVHRVDKEEIREAKRILSKMNADGCFRMNMQRQGGPC